MHVADFARSLATSCGIILTAAMASGGAAAQGQTGDVAGVWIDHTGQGAVEIAPCGSRLCGRVVWLKNPNHRSKSGKRICGAQILGDLRQEGAKAWGDGWIYNPEDEERFSAAIELAGANTLKVTGYVGLRMLGETFTWRRATAALERCPGAVGASTR